MKSEALGAAELSLRGRLDAVSGKTHDSRRKTKNL